MVGGLLVSNLIRVLSQEDGGALGMGNTTGYGLGSFDTLFIKVKPDGTIEWTKTFGSFAYEGGHDLKRVSGGGYAISGESSTYGAGLRDFLFYTLP